MLDELGFDAISGGLISEALNWERTGHCRCCIIRLFTHWFKYKKRVSGARERKTLHIWMHNCVKGRFHKTLKHTHTDDTQMSCPKCRRTVPEGASFSNTLLSQADWNAPKRASQSILMLIDGRLKEASWSLRSVCLSDTLQVCWLQTL